MLQAMNVKIKGIAPIILHNVAKVDPKNPLVVEMKKITSKKKKTDADLEELARLEWEAGLYLNDRGEVIVPGIVLDAVLKSGAKKNKLGKQFDAGVFVPEDPKLQHGGPKDLDKLYAAGKFSLTVPVVVQRSKVMRTRPIFPNWELDFVINYNDEVVDRNSVEEALRVAGSQCGICDWRPRHGRYEVVSVN